MNLVVKMKFGSHLYGTNTETSDTDYKGVFLPSLEECLLNKIPKSYNLSTKKGEARNSSEDIDTEIYSLHKFINLAVEGETVAIDMLHAPTNMLLYTSDIWQHITDNKYRFYSKNIRAFIGYALKQAAKYSCKGSRLNSAKDVLDFLKFLPEDSRLGEVWEKIPRDDNVFDTVDSPQEIKQISIVSKIFQETSPIRVVLESLERFYENYGNRAKLAANNESLDFKAISHALRAAYQVKSILINKNIVFPLPQADFLKRVKSGSIDFNIIAPILDREIDEVRELAEKSDLPEKVDRKYWDDFIVKVYYESHF